TYSGHPLACAAGLAAIDVYEELDLFNRTAAISAYWEKQAHALQGEPHIVDIRTIGLLAAIEIAPRPDEPGSRSAAAGNLCYEAGVLV
ncbi:aminotransferase class III-fold pyridoxal phosphate-dependent enzyme, partial [Klebsiella pneumoniae]|uniref:aminotransferase class III-fold pyridoxal phosphate-dependent enzyme n=1 Tax=Klebsiella pneumoniae TaxID=573 RepID=UPI0013D3E9AA